MKRVRRLGMDDPPEESANQEQPAQEDGESPAFLLERSNALDALAIEAENAAKPGKPKGRAKKQPSAPVARLVPPPLHADDALAFSCTFAWGHRLAFTIVRSASIGKTTVLDFLPTGLRLQQVNGASTCFIELNVPKANFLAWNVPDEGCTRILYYEELEFLATNSKADHTLTFFARKDDPDYVWARLYSAESDRRIRLSLKDGDKMRDVVEIPHETWQYPCRVRMDSLLLKDEIMSCEKAKSIAVELTIAGEKLVITTFCDDDKKARHTTYQTLLSTEGMLPDHEAGVTGIAANQLFSVAFFSLLMKLREVSTHVAVSFGLTGKPLRLAFAMEKPGDDAAESLGTITALLMDKEK